MTGKKCLRRLLAALPVLALLLCLSPAAFALVEQSESFYAADYANVLREDTESWLCQVNAELEEQCRGAQLVVVTVDYLDGRTSDVCARELFYDWGVGSADYDNGTLLLLVTQENKAWLEYGLGLDSWLGNGQVDELLEETFWEPFDRGEYDEAVTALASALLERYDDAYGSSVASGGQALSPEGPAGSYPAVSEEESSMSPSPVPFLIILIIVIVLFSGRSRRRRRYRNYRGYRQSPPPPPPPPPPGGFYSHRGPAPRRPAPPPPSGGAFWGGGAPRTPRPSRPSPPSGGGSRGGSAPRPSSPPRSGGGMGHGGGGRPGGGGGRR